MASITPFVNDDDIDRAEFYTLFAHLFMELPDEATVQQVRELFRIESEDAVEEIQDDFTRSVLTPEFRFSPYESLFNVPLGDTPRVWGKASQDVQVFYVSAGVMIDDELDVAPDHLAAELLFMSYLVENGLAEKQMRFMDEHLARWVADYCTELERHAKTAFYREIAKLLKEFILSEQEALTKG